MITLYQYPPHWGLPNVSLFCMKLECYLKMTGIAYQVKVLRDPRKAPKGKLPFINDNGFILADSSLIIDYLQKKYAPNLDAHLSPLQQGMSLAMQRLIEEHLYWILLYSRWCEDDNWLICKPEFFGKKRGFFLNFIAETVRKKQFKVLYAHGIGRHSSADMYKFGVKDLEALDILFTGPFIFGEKPSTLDASLYALLANIMVPPIPSPLQTYAKANKKFVEYCDLMKNTYAI
ncbi:MAG: glutathione S-transferase family protein [Proteobacteria bacterium]|nr:glutathione S-transferase family protein [Pseudomonadota bacterium]